MQSCSLADVWLNNAMESNVFNHTKKVSLFLEGKKCLDLNKSKVFGKEIKLTFALKKNLVGRVLKVLQRNVHNLKCQVKVK